MTSLGTEIPTIYTLDGGLSTQLSCHIGAQSDGDPLWSARFLQTNPEDIVKAHLDFLRAGADVISTNTYQASIGGFVKYLGVTPEEGYALIRRAVELAKRARDTYQEECSTNMPLDQLPIIAGSVGPYGAHLLDGSEYRGNYAEKTSKETMKEWHKPRINALIEAGVDLLAFETIPCLKEAEVLTEMLKEYPTMKAWLSFSVQDDTCISNGENFQEVAIKCWNSNPGQLLAIGVNCCPPQNVAKLFKGINEGRKDSPIPLVTYPNSGEKYNPQLGWIDRDKCESLDSFVDDWLDVGVRYVGGCCRTYATDVLCIRTKVQSWCDKKRFGDLKNSLDRN